jgi:hypothetical protein
MEMSCPFLPMHHHSAQGSFGMLFVEFDHHMVPRSELKGHSQPPLHARGGLVVHIEVVGEQYCAVVLFELRLEGVEESPQENLVASKFHFDNAACAVAPNLKQAFSGGMAIFAIHVFAFRLQLYNALCFAVP